MKRTGLLYAVVWLLAVPLAAPAADAPSSSDLIGRWSGEPPMGGKLEIDVTSVEGGKIAGSAKIPGRGGKGEIPMLSGDVKGKRVRLQTRFSGAGGGNTVVYRCEFTKKDELPCTTAAGKKTTFAKVHS
ncbi:MAG TPA: hypothetical protein VGH16_14815 [Candidatus Binatia bacterium]|jgi:hypothetical protein